MRTSARVGFPAESQAPDLAPSRPYPQGALGSDSAPEQLSGRTDVAGGLAWASMLG